jgi:hypothetical protein
MKIYKFLFFILSFNLVYIKTNTSLAAREELELKPPSSNIPEGEKFKSSCYFVGVYDMANIQSFKLQDRTLTTASLKANPSLQYTEIPQDGIITANCTNNTYVFENNRNPSALPRRSFQMKCEEGGILKKVKDMDFCDVRCDITDLEEIGYKAPKPILAPGEEILIRCPDGKTTRTGESFRIKCVSKGLLNASSPSCFDKITSCTGPNQDKLPQGARLNCEDEDGGLTYVLCEAGKWEENEFYKKRGNTCKETIGQVDFAFLETINLNNIETIDTFTQIPIEEFLEFCKAHPNDNDCKKQDFKCRFKDAEYGLSHTLFLRCPDYDNNIVKFICYNDTWSFAGFDSDADMPSGFIAQINKCGAESLIVDSILPDSSSSAVRARLLPDPNAPTTLEEFKEDKIKEAKMKRRQSER